MPFTAIQAAWSAVRIEEAQRGGGSCVSQLDQCSILELLQP